MLSGMSSPLSRVHEPLAALRDVFRNPNLRRVQLAFMGSVTGQYAFSVALSVYAYHHGGATTVGDEKEGNPHVSG